MARKYGNNKKRIVRGKKIAKMKIHELRGRLELLKREFETSKYYKHLSDRYNALIDSQFGSPHQTYF